MKKYFIYIFFYICTIFICISAYLFSIHPIENKILTIVRFIMICFASVLLIKYTCYMMIAPLQKLKDRKIIRDKTYTPLVSIMIPAWNEEVGIISTVKTLLLSSYRNIEIIIVNDGSTDNSDKIIQQFILKYREKTQYERNIPQLVYYYKENGGKGTALNKAIELAKGDILVSIDADCAVHHLAIENFVKCFQDKTVMAAVGNVIVLNTKTFVGMLQYLEYLFGFYFKKADSFLNTIYIIGGAAGAFRKEVFEKLGKYSTTNITEDIELSVRIQNAGMRIMYAHDAIVYTEGASSIKTLIKQRLRWKQGRFQTFKEHRDMFFSFKKEHNKILSWIIFPLAFFGDVQLSLELPFIGLMYIIAILTGDFSSFISGVLVVSLMFMIQAIDNIYAENKWYILLAPIGWLLFYIITFVEVVALFQSLYMIIRKKEAKWQHWQRKGVAD